MGLSTWQPRRSLMSHTEDIRQLADHLGIDRFAVLGGSGGGPFALACAYTNKIPRDRLTAIGLLSSSGPWCAGTQDVPLPSRVVAHLVRSTPRLAVGLFGAVARCARSVLSTQTGLNMLKTQLAKMHHDETDGKVDDVLARETARVLLESFAQGGAGAVDDARLLIDPEWGGLFNASSSSSSSCFRPVKIFHGDKDVNAPVRLVQYLADRVPGSILYRYPNDTHFTMSQRLNEVMTILFDPTHSRVESD